MAQSALREYGQREFSVAERKELQQLLEAKIPGDHISTRTGAGGAAVAYLETWRAIETANAIFSFDGWSTSIGALTVDKVTPPEGRNDRHSVIVSVIMRITLRDGSYREDVGVGSHENKSLSSAMENAKKEAVSDALKRTARQFGNALGNSIYDKVHANFEVKAKKERDQKEKEAGRANPHTLPKGPITFAGIRQNLLNHLNEADTIRTHPSATSNVTSNSNTNQHQNGCGDDTNNHNTANVGLGAFGASPYQPNNTNGTNAAAAAAAAAAATTTAYPTSSFSSSPHTSSSAGGAAFSTHSTGGEQHTSPFAPRVFPTTSANTSTLSTSAIIPSHTSPSHNHTTSPPNAPPNHTSVSQNVPAVSPPSPFGLGPSKNASHPQIASTSAKQPPPLPAAPSAPSATSASTLASTTAPSAASTTVHSTASTLPPTSSPSPSSSSTISPSVNDLLADLEEVEDDDLAMMESALMVERKKDLKEVYGSPSSANPNTALTTHNPSTGGSHSPAAPSSPSQFPAAPSVAPSTTLFPSSASLSASPSSSPLPTNSSVSSSTAAQPLTAAQKAAQFAEATSVLMDLADFE